MRKRKSRCSSSTVLQYIYSVRLEDAIPFSKMLSKSSEVCGLLGARVVIFFLTTIERYRSELTLVMNVGYFAAVETQK